MNCPNCPKKTRIELAAQITKLTRDASATLVVLAAFLEKLS